MAPPKGLAQFWDAVLATEGLQPLDTPKAAGAYRQKLHYLRGLTAEEREARVAYYTKAQGKLERLVLAHAVWALFSQGHGGREIARRLGVGYKKVRLVLETLQGLFHMPPASWGGKDEDEVP